MNYTETNKLIAEFMGYTKDTDELYLIDDYNIRSEEEYQATYVSEMKFHKSWKWLMPVVLHIEEIPLEETDTYKVHRFSVRSEGIVCEITDNKTKEVVAYSDECDKQSNIYQAVVEFIKFYNQNK
jgi:hypothetical protein